MAALVFGIIVYVNRRTASPSSRWQFSYQQQPIHPQRAPLRLRGGGTQSDHFGTCESSIAGLGLRLVSACTERIWSLAINFEMFSSSRAMEAAVARHEGNGKHCLSVHSHDDDTDPASVVIDQAEYPWDVAIELYKFMPHSQHVIGIMDATNEPFALLNDAAWHDTILSASTESEARALYETRSNSFNHAVFLAECTLNAAETSMSIANLCVKFKTWPNVGDELFVEYGWPYWRMLWLKHMASSTGTLNCWRQIQGWSGKFKTIKGVNGKDLMLTCANLLEPGWMLTTNATMQYGARAGSGTRRDRPSYVNHRLQQALNLKSFKTYVDNLVADTDVADHAVDDSHSIGLYMRWRYTCLNKSHSGSPATGRAKGRKAGNLPRAAQKALVGSATLDAVNGFSFVQPISSNVGTYVLMVIVAVAVVSLIAYNMGYFKSKSFQAKSNAGKINIAKRWAASEHARARVRAEKARVKAARQAALAASASAAAISAHAATVLQAMAEPPSAPPSPPSANEITVDNATLFELMRVVLSIAEARVDAPYAWVFDEYNISFLLNVIDTADINNDSNVYADAYGTPGDTEAGTSNVDEDHDELTGIITDYYSSRGYGFIEPLNTDAEQTSYFFHVSNLSDGWNDYMPDSGYFVTFNTEFDAERNNRVAINIAYNDSNN